MNPIFKNQHYRSIDDLGGGGEIDNDIYPPEELDAPEEPVQEEREPSLTEQIQHAVETTVRNTVAELKASEEAQRRQQSYQPQPYQPVTYMDPSHEAVAAVNLRDQLLEEVSEMLTEAPAEVKREVTATLRNFGTLWELEGVRNAGLHRHFVDAALGRAIREGKYDPRGGGAPSREPVYSEPATRIPNEFRREQEEVCRVLGVTLTEEELRQAWRNR